MTIRTNSIMKSVIFSGLLFSSFSLIAQPAAAASDLLQPNSPWALSRIADANGDEYCALARRFTNDVVLTIARNGSSENSVAVDFQKSVLENSKDYVFALDAGHNQVRAFNTNSVQGRALVARLGKDDAFYDALSSSGSLKVTIDDKLYNFNLSEFSDGQQELEYCTTDLVEPAAGEIESYTDNNMSAVEQVAAVKSLEVSSDGMDDLDVEALRMENLKLRNALKTERQMYEEKYFEKSDTSSSIVELKEKIELLELENKNLKQGTGTATEDINAQNKIKELERQISMLSQKQNETNMQDSLKGHKELNTLREELVSAKAERDRLKDELERIQNDSEQSFIKTIAGNDWDLEIATRRFNEAERETRRLGALLEKERESCNREKRDIEYMLFDPEIAEKEQISKLIELENDLKTTKMELQAQKDTYEDQIVYLRSKLEGSSATEGRIAYLESELSMAKDSDNERIAYLQEQLNVAKAEASNLDSLKMQLEQSKQRERELEMRMTQMASVNSSEQLIDHDGAMQLDESQRRIAELEEQLKQTELEASEHIAYLEGQLDSLEKEANEYIAELQGKLDQLMEQGNANQANQMVSNRQQSDVQQLPPPQSLNIQDNKLSSSPPYNMEPPYLSAVDINNLLSSSGVNIVGEIDRVKSVSGDGYIAHSWDTGNLFGSMEQHRMATVNEFDILLGKYLRKTEARCKGEFAAIPSVAQRYGSLRVESYEIACVGDDESASASLIFFNQNDVFLTIAHETGMDGMNMAMDIRDRLISSIVRTNSPGY